MVDTAYYDELVKKLKLGLITPEEFDRLAKQAVERATTTSSPDERESVTEERIKDAARKARVL